MKKLSITFLVLVLLSAMCFFAYLLYQKKNTPQTQTKNEAVSDYQYIFIDSISEYNKSDNTDQDISNYDKPEKKNVYIPIPKEKSAQYKAEIEKIIDEQVPLAKKEVDKIFNEAQNEYISGKANSDDLDGWTREIDAPAFYLYLKLINTTDKYVSIKQYTPHTGESVNLAIFVYPYLKDNNVDTSKLEELDQYSYTKAEKINEYYLKTIEKEDHLFR